MKIVFVPSDYDHQYDCAIQNFWLTRTGMLEITLCRYYHRRSVTGNYQQQYSAALRPSTGASPTKSYMLAAHTDLFQDKGRGNSNTLLVLMCFNMLTFVKISAVLLCLHSVNEKNDLHVQLIVRTCKDCIFIC